MTEAVPAAGFTRASAEARPGRALALFLLTAVGTLNFVDRQLVSVLAEPIRTDLHLNDTELGLLTGLSFALFYAALGVPAALLADRANRVRLVACACAVWSVFTGLSGLAGGFWTLALARFGVGVGESGGTAPSLSILADYYPPQKRAAVTGLFTANGPLGVFLAASLGGWAAGRLGWRGAFFAVSLIGALTAPLLALLVKEPRRGETDPLPLARPDPRPSGLCAAGAAFARPSLALLLAASGLSAFVSYGLLNWLPPFLMRVRHMPLAAVAAWFGPAAGACMGAGIWGGGLIVNAAARISGRAYALVPAAAMLLAGPLLALALIAPTWPLALGLLLAPMACVTIYVAPALSLVQNVTPTRARATATALLLLAFNIVGLGGGPLAVGLLSDAFARAHVQDPLKIALLCLAPGAAVAGAVYLLMSRTILADLAHLTPETSP